MSGFTSLPITGIKAGNKVYPRQEINEWAANNPIQLSLYIRALQIFQAIPFDQVNSYFQVAGIHGLPAIPWDNDPAPIEATESFFTDGTSGPDITKEFYCPHNTLLFPSWHRVYVLLFEQLLWQIMNEKIVPQVPNDQQGLWQNMANSWRLPYWDWAANPRVPDVVRNATVSIVNFDSKTQETTSNPLYQFSTGAISTFQEAGTVPVLNDRSSFGQWTIFNDAPLSWTSGTSRWGLNNSSSGANVLTPQQVAGVQNNDFVDMALQSPDWSVIQKKDKDGNPIPALSNGNLLDQVSRLWVPSNFDNFAEFATTSHGGGDPNGWLSLEMIHNYIHDLVGGVGWNPDPNPNQKPGDDGAPYTYGHMADLGTAAFDPIFWLHHCNVDRQLAIYQANKGKAWFTGYDSKIDPSVTDNLYPFHTDTKFTNWNSTMVENWTNLGYTYDVLKPEKDSNDDKASPELIQRRLTETYGHLRKTIHGVSEQNIKGIENDYVINIIYNRFALNGSSYIIHFFIGKEEDIPKDPANYKLSFDHVGSLHTFSSNYWTRGNKNGINCENCQKQQDKHQLSKGQIPVTLQLLQRALSHDQRWKDISHLERGHVAKYLTDNLHWRAVAVPNRLLDLKELPDLKVIFKAGKAEHPKDASKPSRFYGYEHQWEVTNRKDGGARDE
ncbi:di-copper centre-containing [Fusarium longipes]|uniref:tyrosinase n=1 Tax=Fusarium longipes TaxID=694270 RepID=A0A395SCU4_9HYPO|nr:di-copper centre-containing [Fusarium longipes]